MVIDSPAVKKVEISGPPLDGKLTQKTEELKSLLLKTKKEFDLFDKSLPSAEERIQFVEGKKAHLFAALNKHYEELWGIIMGMSEFEYRYHQRYYQNEMLPLIATQPLNRRIYEKPLGYPGDYIMMNYYHENGYRGENTYEILMHRYTLSTPLARVVINRGKQIEVVIKDVLSKNPKGGYEVLNIGCGPAKEMLDVITSVKVPANTVFNCLDSEQKALQQIRENVAFAEAARKGSFNFNYYNLNVLKLIKAHKKGLIKKQKFIYCLGLFDYLKDKIASRLIEVLFELLDEGGSMFIANFNKNMHLRAYMEFLGEWYLILRDEEEMLRLAANIKGAKSIATEKESETGQGVYLTLKK